VTWQEKLSYSPETA